MNDLIDVYLEQYGTKGLHLLLQRFIQLSPSFEGDRELARELGAASAMIQDILTEYVANKPR